MITSVLSHPARIPTSMRRQGTVSTVAGALIFIHIFCRIVSGRDGRDRSPSGPREWWANGMPLRSKHSQFIRPDASEKRPCRGIRCNVYKDQAGASCSKPSPACPALSRSALDVARRCHRTGRARQREWRTALPAVTPNRRPACCGAVKHRPHLEYLQTAGGTPVCPYSRDGCFPHGARMPPSRHLRSAISRLFLFFFLSAFQLFSFSAFTNRLRVMT
jgi:hypothetical protein